MVSVRLLEGTETVLSRALSIIELRSCRVGSRKVHLSPVLCSIQLKQAHGVNSVLTGELRSNTMYYYCRILCVAIHLRKVGNFENVHPFQTLLTLKKYSNIVSIGGVKRHVNT